MTAIARRVAPSLALALALMAGPFEAPAAAGDVAAPLAPAALPPATPASFPVDLASLAAPRLLLTRLRQQFGAALTPRDMVSWTEFVVLAEAVTGDPLGVAVTPESIHTSSVSVPLRRSLGQSAGTGAPARMVSTDEAHHQSPP